MRESVQIVCREDNQEHLLAQLAIQELDVVLSDTPIGSPAKVRAYNHLMGECGPELYKNHRKRFPKVLEGAPLLLPADNTNVRQTLDQWLDSQQIRPFVVGQFEDFALLRHFGETGAGIFAAPSVLEKPFRKQRNLRVIGRIEPGILDDRAMASIAHPTQAAFQVRYHHAILTVVLVRRA